MTALHAPTDLVPAEPFDDHEEEDLIATWHLPLELWSIVIDYLPAQPDPEAVERFLAEQLERGVPAEDRGFYWPTLRRVYRSRSSARNRLSIFEAYGARGHIVRARPTWERVESKDATIERLRARVAELESR